MTGFELAARLAAHHGATVYLLARSEAERGRTSGAREGESAKAEIGKLRALAERSGIGFRSQCIVGVGEPADEIVKVAKTVRADLIVIGTPAQPTILRLLVGSVAERVLERSSSPVLVALCRGVRILEAATLRPKSEDRLTRSNTDV